MPSTQEAVELGQIGVRQDRLIQIDQREARHLDVLFLSHGSAADKGIRA